IGNSDETSVVYNLALNYLQVQCNGVNSCIDLSSLHVYYVNNEASSQLAALIIGCFLDILYIAVIIKVRKAVKQTNETIANNALIKEVLVVQIPNQNQNVNTQPIQVPHQINSPISMNNNQPLPNQNYFNNQQNNLYNYPSNLPQQQNLNPGMQYQNQQHSYQYYQ
ncbi:transmembrane protein, putative, partial (macronuclear) [Tetrahymena thermophila SB210]